MTATADEDPRTVWDAVADGWERHEHDLRQHTGPLDERMVAAAAPARGEVVLELAAGLGELSAAVAQQVAPDGEVICSDAAPRMVEAARRRGPRPSRLRFEVLDAQDLTLADDGVDLVLVKMGLMLFSDPERAVAECRRVLRPGGRLVAATWGPAERNPWIAVFGAAMLMHGHAPPGDPNGPGGIFSLSDPGSLTRLLSRAGFPDVEVGAVELSERAGTFEEYWHRRADTSGPLTVLLRSLPADQVARVQATCRELAQGFRDGARGFRFPGHALLARAT
jgi:ubiquinone/menaquinone biosynthesis C-methylase UbiE